MRAANRGGLRWPQVPGTGQKCLYREQGCMLTCGCFPEKPSWIPGTIALPCVQALVALWEIPISPPGSRLPPRPASDIQVTELHLLLSSSDTQICRLPQGKHLLTLQRAQILFAPPKAGFSHASPLGQDPIQMGKVFGMASSYKMNSCSLEKTHLPAQSWCGGYVTLRVCLLAWPPCGGIPLGAHV